MKQRPIQTFVLGVLLFLPITFAIWYLAAFIHLAPLTWLTEQLVQLSFPQSVLWLKLDGNTLVLASNFGTDARGAIVSPPVSDDLMGFHLNPLIYTYSLPLLYALILASAGNIMMSLTHYATGTAPVIFSSGFATLGEWWKAGFIMSIVNSLLWLVVGLVWWKLLGYY